MKKTMVKLFGVVVCLVLLLSILPGYALAADDGDMNGWSEPGWLENGEDNNGTGNDEISLGQQKQLNDILYRMVEQANSRVLCLVAYAQSTPENDVNWLLEQVNAAVSPVFTFADSIGATVVCEYVTYEIDGQTVIIDPIRVVNVV